MPATGAYNTWGWNAIPWNGARARGAATTFITPLRRTCLTAPFSWVQALTVLMGCDVPKEYNIKSSDALIIGSDRRVNLSLTGLPTGRTITAASLLIKTRQSDADAEALITKTITATQSASGQITDAGTDATAAVYFDISHTDSAGLTANKIYHYFIKLTCSDGVIDIPIRGQLPTAKA